MGYTKEQRIINSVSGTTKSKVVPQNISGPKWELPNNSGDHHRSIKRDDPINDYDLVNKGYVDAQFPVLLNEVGNPDGDKTFNMTTRQLKFLWTNPAGNPMELEASGGYTGAVLHIHQHTGNPGATRLFEIEADDTDVIHMLSTGALATTGVLCNRVTGDSDDRYLLSSDGKLSWGDGTNPVDTTLYRSAANILKTDDAFHCIGADVGSQKITNVLDPTNNQDAVTLAFANANYATVSHEHTVGRSQTTGMAGVSRALNTTYQNTSGDDMEVYGSVECYIENSLEDAYAELKTDSSTPPTTVVQKVGHDDSEGEETVQYVKWKHAFYMHVADNDYYRIDSTVTGNATVTLLYWNEVTKDITIG